jgi:hypothetical protein
MQDNEKAYTKAELRRAKEAAEMIRNSGFTSERDAVNLVQDNNVEDSRHSLRHAVRELSRQKTKKGATHCVDQSNGSA